MIVLRSTSTDGCRTLNSRVGSVASMSSGTRRDQVVEMWALWMCCGEPIANLVLGLDTGKEDHPVNMLPVISQLGL